MSRQEAVTVIRLDTTALPGQAAQVQQAFGRMAGAGEASAGQIKAAMRSLPAQFTDVATQLAGGQNPLLILLQQGGQVRDQFGSMGAALRGVVTFLNPVTVGMAALAATVGAAAYAAYQGHQEAVLLAKALALNGSAAGKTVGEIDAMAKSMAAASTSGVGVFREALNGLAASGAFAGGNLALASRATVALEKLSGQSTEQIVKDLASMREGVASWAVAHNRAYNFLTANQYKYILGLEAQGRTQDAAKVVLESLAQTMEARTAPALGSIERLLDSGKKLWDGWWDAAKGIGRADTLEQQLEKVKQELQSFEENMPGANVDAERRAQIDAQYRAKLNERRSLEGRIATEKEDAASKAKQAEDERRKIEQAQAASVAAQLGVDAAAEAKRFAMLVAGGNARRVEIERQYEQLSISGRAYYEQITELERQRADAEVRDAQQAIARERSRVAGTPQEALARNQAVIQAETKLIEVRSRRAQLDADIANGKYDPKARNVTEGPQSLFRQSELAGQASLEQARSESARQAMVQQADLMQSLLDGNARLNVDLIADDKQRALAQLALERATLQKRIEILYGAEAQAAEAERRTGHIADDRERLEARLQVEREFVERRAAILAQADQQSAGSRQLVEMRFAKDTALVTREETRNALAAAFRDTKSPIKAFGDALGNIIFQRVTTSLADALLNSAFGSGTGFGGGLLGSLWGAVSGNPFSALVGASGFGDYNAVAAIAGQRAGGGPVDAGKTYLVGEQGPELLRMGGQGGRIVPNSALGGQAGHTVIINQTLNVGDGVTYNQVAAAARRAKDEAVAEIHQTLARDRIV